MVPQVKRAKNETNSGVQTDLNTKFRLATHGLENTEKNMYLKSKKCFEGSIRQFMLISYKQRPLDREKL